MTTTVQAALKADWAPAIESTARFVGVAIACVIVAVDWLRFAWHHPWAGLRALEFPGAATSSPNLAVSSPNLTSNSPRSAASSPRSERVAPLLLLPAPAPLLLAPAPEPIATAPAPRKRGRRATRQPKAV